jgi:putative heme iron utilization protein
MADQTSKDAAMKERIIKHMNNDHADSLSLYLQHYNKLSASSARGARMTDISLSAMTFQTTDGKTHTIPLNPPMTSFADARTRSVDMDREARSALDISRIKLTSYPLHESPHMSSSSASA